MGNMVSGNSRMFVLKDSLKSTVLIGGRQYPTIKIGNQTWLAQNLDLRWDGLTIGGSFSSTAQVAHYYSNDEASYGWEGKKWGLLYNGPAVDYMEANKSTFFNGWHVATDADFQELKAFVDNDYFDGLALRTKDNDWGSAKGLDCYGFSAPPSGNAEERSGSFFYKGTHFFCKNNRQVRRH